MRRSCRPCQVVKSLWILVDEFQDTDRTQASILQRLAGSEWLAGRLFLVGDVKQSIYRFRGARPELFHDFENAFGPAGQRQLTESFRAVPGAHRFHERSFLGRVSRRRPSAARPPPPRLMTRSLPSLSCWLTIPKRRQHEWPRAERSRRPG